MDIIVRLFSFWVETLIFYYSIVLILAYMVVGFISFFMLRKYYFYSKIPDYSEVLSSPFVPGISILAPAYNESLNIVENVKALLALYYANFEVIVINDGSSDDTLDCLIESFGLEKVPYVLDKQIETEDIRAVYKSRKQALNNLVVIDKENGGKADALNAGLNVAEGDYFISIDVDSIIDPYALQKMVKPFLQGNKGRQVIAVGGVIRLANSCEIQDGQLVSVDLPKKMLPFFQVLEYDRSFLMGRMGWSRLNGLLIISGALGLFDKDIVIECGGYHKNTVGEDMEIVVRMRRYMEEQKRKYKVEYVAEPLCWTEGPSTLSTFVRQRNRWTRGTIETLFSHWKIFFNPKYKLMGMVAHPYWVFFEWLAPILEFLGILYFIVIAVLGFANWTYFFIILFFVYFFSVAFTAYAILYDHIALYSYKKKSMVMKQLLFAFFEPFVYHPLVLYSAIKGNFDYFILRKRSWGHMKRVGLNNFNKKKQK